MLPLEGITVVGIEQAVAAPLATRHCADLGARVVKVERVDGGDFARGYDDDAVTGWRRISFGSIEEKSRLPST